MEYNEQNIRLEMPPGYNQWIYNDEYPGSVLIKACEEYKKYLEAIEKGTS